MSENMKYTKEMNSKASSAGIYVEDMGPLDFVYNHQNIDEINQQLNQTRSQRIRAAMFPESLEDYGYGNLNQPNGGGSSNPPPLPGRPTAVQRLVQPTHQLKNAIMNLINYQEDADVTIKAIPELLKLLNDDDKAVVCKTLKLIDQLSRKDASKLALTSSQALITSLINLIFKRKRQRFRSVIFKHFKQSLLG